MTIANGDPLNPDLSYMGEENYLNLNLAFIFYQIKKKKKKKAEGQKSNKWSKRKKELIIKVFFGAASNSWQE